MNPYVLLWNSLTRKERAKIVKRAMNARVYPLEILKIEYPDLQK